MRISPQGNGRLTKKSRSVMYTLQYDREDRNLYEAEARIAKMLSESPVVGAYYAKNGTIWFEAAPGRMARSLRTEISALLG